jgi:predicted MPP superfamily phosphohydrolase
MQITRYEFKAPVKRPIRAAFVADTHDKPYGKIVEAIKSNKVDVILHTGDIIYAHDDHVVRAFDMLKEFISIAPTFMSLGNHEGGAVPLVRNKCREIGVKLLEDEYEMFEDICIGGLTSGYIADIKALEENHWRKTPDPNFAWMKAFSDLPGYKVLLNHHPEYFPEYIKELNIDLTLSGHAHGGQWRIFGLGVFAPGQGLFPKYTSGIYDNRLIVSRGLANNAPPFPRIFNSKELIFIDFHQ